MVIILNLISINVNGTFHRFLSLFQDAIQVTWTMIVAMMEIVEKEKEIVIRILIVEEV